MSQSGTVPKLLGNDAIAAAMRSGHVNIASAMVVEEMDLSAESRQAQMQHAETLRRFEAQQRSRAIVVPTSAEDVKQKLRELGKPVTFFGEGPADRRERLKEVIAALELDEEDAKQFQTYMGKVSQQVPMPGGYNDSLKSSAGQSGGPNAKEVFYSPASEQLIAMRNYICDYSFPRTHERLLRTKRIRESEAEQAEEDHRVAGMYVHMRDLCLSRSEFGDDRPMCSVRFSPDSSFVAVGSWTGTVKLWDSRNLSYCGSLSGHEERVTSVAWQPEPVGGHHLLASSAADGKVFLWDCREGGHMSTIPVRPLNSVSSTHLQQKATGHEVNGKDEFSAMEIAAQDTNRSTEGSLSKRVGMFEGHQGVVSRCAFHPSGLLLGSTGYDFTWRLWDVETTTELQLQDGHSKECNAIDFHHDGSLVVTGDLGGVVLVWDLRSGQTVQLFQGHIKKIVSASFNVNGYMIATGSTDNNVKVWDLRSKKCGYTLPAHSHAICEAKFSSSGEALLTGSFDGTLKLWNTRNFDILKTLTGHAGKIMSCDISQDESCLVSSGYDRTVKLWAKDV